MAADFESWPVLPEGVEAVLLLRAPVEAVETELECFVCDELVEEHEMCFGVPERGVAHERCWDPGEDDGAGA